MVFDHIKEDIEGEQHDSFRLCVLEYVHNAGHNAAFERSQPVKTSLMVVFRLLVILD